MFCVSVKPWFHSDTPVWVPFTWTQKMLEVSRCGGSLSLVKEQGCHDGHQIMVLKVSVRKAYVHQDLRVSYPFAILLFCFVLMYSTSQHSIISEKSWMLISSAVRTWAVGLLFFPHKIRHFPLNDHEKEDIPLKKEVKKIGHVNSHSVFATSTLLSCIWNS
jgi:hypothetical protein